MVSLRIELPNDLHKAAKTKALANDSSLKDFVITAIKERVGNS